MSITIKHFGINESNNLQVSEYRVYRSEVSREDATTGGTLIATLQPGTTSYVDETVEEDKLYWYRVDTVTERGLTRGGVKANQYVRTNGIGDGTYLVGDAECGYMNVQPEHAAPLRAAYMSKFALMLRESGLVMNAASGSTEYVHTGVMVDGECFFLMSASPSISNSGMYSSTADRNINRLLAADRIFSYNGDFYEVDVVKASEVMKLHKFASVHYRAPQVAERLPFTARGSVNTCARRPAEPDTLTVPNNTNEFLIYPLGNDPVNQRAATATAQNVGQIDFVVRLIR